MPLFRWFILRRIRQDAARTALTVAGIALGVAVVIAIRMANASALGGFAEALDTVAGKTSLEVSGAGVGVDEDRLATLGWLREWGEVSPVVEGDAFAGLSGGRGESMRVLGIDILRDQPFREYRLLDVGSSSSAAEAASVPPAVPAQPPAQQVLSLLIDPGSVIITASFADRHGLRVGSTLSLAIGDSLRPFTVRGLLRNEGPARVLDGNFVLMDIAAAQLAFDRLGRVDRVDVRLHDPSRLDEAEQAIARRLPAGLAVQRPARRGAQVEKMLAAFHFNLNALSYVALLVGLFLVYNTVATSVIARRVEIGVLRAVGSSRRLVVALFLGEAAAMAVAGCLIGLPLGWGLARGAVRFTSATVQTLYVADAAAVPSLDWTLVALAFLIGVPLALVAALAPALEAAKVSPLDALRPAHAWSDPGRSRAWVRYAGLLCLAGAAMSSRAPVVEGLPLFGFAAALFTVLGLSLLVPATLRSLASLSSRASGWLGVEARLAHANLSGAIPRLSVSVAALSVSLAMLVAIAVMIGSFRETVIYWVGQTLQADLYVSTARRSSLDAQNTVSPALETAVASDPAVAAIDRFRALSLPFRDRLIVLGSGDFAVLLEHGALVFKSPGNAAAAMRQAIGTDAVVVSEALALRFGVSVEDTIQLRTPSGERPFRVAAVYYDYSTDRGVAVMDRTTFRRHFGDLRPTSLTVYLRDEADPEAVRARLMDEIGTAHRVFIHTNASLRAEVLRIFDATFAITYGLEAVAILVAMLGVTGTLVTLVLERRGELAVLRLVGADFRQVRRMVMIEAGMLAVVSQALGLASGFALSLILIYVINVQSFGWTIQFHAPVAFLVQAMLVLLATTTLAGVYPAHLAAGFRPAEEVAAE